MLFFPLSSLSPSLPDDDNLDAAEDEDMLKSRKLPVLLFIHGDNLFWGSGNYVDASLISFTANIIVITMNYRLGVFGKSFLHPYSFPPSRDSLSGDSLLRARFACSSPQRVGDTTGGHCSLFRRCPEKKNTTTAVSTTAAGSTAGDWCHASPSVLALYPSQASH